MKYRKYLVIFIIIIFFSFLFFLKRGFFLFRVKILKNDFISLISSKKISQDIINKRKKFINEYYQTEKLLLSYENKENIILSLFNTKNKNIQTDQIDLFYHNDLINKKIQLLHSDKDENKIVKIFNFIQNNSYHSYPLFESHELHDPQKYFSIYGSGFCDDVAKNFYILATQSGFKSRVWSLNGHVVSDVFYNKKWHIVDPDWQGLVWYENEIASMDQMVLLAKKNALKKGLNELYTSINDNKHKIYPFLINQKSPAISLNFEAREKKILLDKAFILSTDGNYLHELNPASFFSQYKGMANIIYEIPLQQLKSQSGNIKISSFFPICGIYLKINSPAAIQQFKIKLDTEKKIIKSFYSGNIINIKGIQYTDFSHLCRNLEFFPSRQLFIKKNYKLKEGKLLVICYYSLNNLQLNNENLKQELAKYSINLIKY